MTLYNYTLSNIYGNDEVDISNIFIGNYRSINVGNYLVDISNVKLYGSLAYNYQINTILTSSGNIIPKYITITGNDKIYDQTTTATVAINGLIGSETVSYNAYYNSINVGNKIINITIETQTISSLLYSNPTQPITNVPTSIAGFSISNVNRAVFCGNNSYIYYATINNGIWSSLTQTLETTSRGYLNITVSSDGTRAVVGSLSNNYCYFMTWNGTNYSALTQILDTTARNYWGSYLSKDGLRMFAVAKGNYIYYADWNGTNYNILTQTLETNIREYSKICCSLDKTRIIYTTDTNSYIYYADWNGSNYGSYIQTLETRTSQDWQGITCSRNGKKIIYVFFQLNNLWCLIHYLIIKYFPN
jgi:hypothetical protein